MSEMQMSEKPRYSYTALSTHVNCPLQFALKYVHKLRNDESALNLEMGTLSHKIKELISLDLMEGRIPDYDAYWDTMEQGYTGTDKASGEIESIPGYVELSQKYPTDWYAPDTKSGLTYEQKLEIFKSHLRDEENDPEWTTIGVEVPFEFEYGDVVLFGFIDKIRRNSKGELSIVDYKTSKKVYADKDIKTPLQMLVYDLAVRHLFPNTPIVAHTYDFVFLGVTQEGGSPGWLKRGETKLNKILDDIRHCKQTDIWKPSPTPLCAWCDYSRTNPKAPKELYDKCPYYSLWTPNDRSYGVARAWDGKRSADILAHAEQNKFWF